MTTPGDPMKSTPAAKAIARRAAAQKAAATRRRQAAAMKAANRRSAKRDPAVTPEESRAKDCALRTLQGAVKLTVHPYERDPFSGAGNCWCGRSEASTLHPHIWVPSSIDRYRCVCSKPPNHRIHRVQTVA